MADVVTPGAPAATGKPGKPSILKKIPTPVIIAGAGALLGVGYAVYRDRNSPGADLVEGDMVDATVAPSEISPISEQYDSGYVPSGVAYGTGGGYSIDSGETVGAVGQTALETTLPAITEIATGAISAIAGNQQAYIEAMAARDAAGTGGATAPDYGAFADALGSLQGSSSGGDVFTPAPVPAIASPPPRRPRPAKKPPKRPGPKGPTAREEAVRKALLAHGPKWNQRKRLLAELAKLRAARGVK